MTSLSNISFCTACKALTAFKVKVYLHNVFMKLLRFLSNRLLISCLSSLYDFIVFLTILTFLHSNNELFRICQNFSVMLFSLFTSFVWLCVFQDLLLGAEMKVVNHNLPLYRFTTLCIVDLSFFEKQWLCFDSILLQRLW